MLTFFLFEPRFRVVEALLRNLTCVIAGQEPLALAISSDSGSYLSLERVLTMDEIATTWEKRPGLAMTLNCNFLSF